MASETSRRMALPCAWEEGGRRMLMRILCRMCRCFAEREPSAKPAGDSAKGQAPDEGKDKQKD